MIRVIFTAICTGPDAQALGMEGLTVLEAGQQIIAAALTGGG